MDKCNIKKVQGGDIMVEAIISIVGHALVDIVVAIISDK